MPAQSHTRHNTRNAFQIGGLKNPARVTLYDQTGRLLRTWESVNATTSLSIADLAQGIYLVKAEDTTAHTTTRLKLVIIP